MTLSRRAVLASTVAAGGVALSGCLGGDDIALEGEPALPVPVAGDPDADVTVMVFEDFSCPACRTFQQTVYPEIGRNFIEPGEIRYEHHDYPLTVNNEWSWQIAGAARSVQDRGGDEAFWVFAEQIYGHFDNYSMETIEQVANEADVDGEAVVTDVEDEQFRSEIETEAERAQDAGVEATPTVVVNGTQVDPVYDDIEAVIEDER